MDQIYHYQETFLENLAKAYTECNTEYIIHSLADNFHYNSMWVFEELNKEKYIKYITTKLAVRYRSKSVFNSCIMYVQGSGEPHLLLTPKTPEGDFGCFIAKANKEGFIEELSLTSGRFYNYGYKDKEKFDIFMERSKEI